MRLCQTNQPRTGFKKMPTMADVLKVYEEQALVCTEIEAREEDNISKAKSALVIAQKEQKLASNLKSFIEDFLGKLEA